MISTFSIVAKKRVTGSDDKGVSGDVRRPRTRSEISLSVHARELVWLDKIRRGYSIKEIARRERLSCRRIQHGVSQARERANLSRTGEPRASDNLQERRVKIRARAGRAIPDDRNRPPRLVPLFPIGAFTPGSACPHHGPIRSGSAFCCMVCSQSGVDDHPALKRDPYTDPRPDCKAPLFRVASVRESRKQRRQRLNTARKAGPNMAAFPSQTTEHTLLRPLIPNS